MGDTMTTTRKNLSLVITNSLHRSSSHPKSNPSRSHARPVSVQKSTHSCGHYCSDAPPPPPSRNLWPAASRILASREDLTNANRCSGSVVGRTEDRRERLYSGTTHLGYARAADTNINTKSNNVSNTINKTYTNEIISEEPIIALYYI